MLERSTIQKNRRLALYATGLKASLVRSISFSATADIFYCSSISEETFLESARMLIKLSSFKRSIISSAAERANNILFSNSYVIFAFLALFSTISSFYAYNSGNSNLIN